MRWTSVAWACCLLPAFTGCNTMSRVMHGASGAGVTNEVGRATDDDARRGAQTAWESVRTRHTQRAFSDEFRDGFVDGYADFLARGGDSQAPAVPPVPYERYKKYFGRDGHALVRDYYLGFNYGSEVAVTTGHRPALTSASTSAKLATRPTSAKTADAGKFAEPKTPSEAPALLSLPSEGGKGKAIPPLPKPEVPVIKPFNPDLTGGGKFAPLLLTPDQDRLPVPSPPLPIPAPVLAAPLLDPPSAVPALPVPEERTLSVLDNIPVIPLRYPPPK
jgi:hypothetical protein